MHELISQVLDRRDLSKAGELFNIDDWDVVTDLQSSLSKLTEIFNSKSYPTDANSQSVVEICLARITSAVRETNSIETYAPGLVDLLESCLRHKLSRMDIYEEDPPHAKIASDLLSCIFLHYGKKSVMMLAIPAAVKILQKGNRDLVRNTSSYLALAAIHNSRLLAQYAQPIINSVSASNYSLVRILPQIYPENREPFHAQLSTIVDCLDVCDPSEKLAVLNLCSMIVNSRPELLAPHSSKFKRFLFSSNTCSAVLHIYLSLVTSGHAASVSGHLNALKKASESMASSQTATVAKIIANVGKLNKSLAREAVTYMIIRCTKVDNSMVPSLLKDVEPLAELYPDVVTPYFPEIMKIADSAPMSVKCIAARIKECCEGSQQQTTRSNLTSSSEKVTLIAINGDTVSNSSWSKESLNSTASVKPNFSSSPSHLLFSSISFTPTSAPKRMNALPIASFARSPTNAMKIPLSSSSYTSQRPSILPGPPYQPPPAYGEYSNIANVRSKSVNNLAPLRSKPSSNHAYHANRARQLEKIRRELQPTAAPSSTTSDSAPFACIDLISGQRNSVYLYPLNSKDEDYSFPTLIELNSDGRIVPISPRNRKPLAAIEDVNRADTERFFVDPSPSPSLKRETSSRVVTTFNKDKSITQRTGSGSMLTVQFGNDLFKLADTDTPNSSSRLRHSTVISIDPFNEDSPKMVDACTQSTATLGSRISTERSNDLIVTYFNGTGILQQKGDDAIKHFCEKHFHKIKVYICDLSTKYPVPCQCTVEESGHRQQVRIHFSCQDRNEYCLHNSNLFAFKTKQPQIWLHLMFLHLQAQSSNALNNNCEAVKKLRTCWECLPPTITKNKGFSMLITSAFPTYKEQQIVLKELQLARYFDLFAYNASKKKWSCFACNHPEKVQTFLSQGDTPIIEGQLKEKKGRWKFFKRWRTRYFTLSGAALSYRGSVSECFSNPAIDLRSIRSVKSLTGRKGRRTIPKAFEIFIDDDRSYVLKARDRKNAEEWFQCLQIAVAQAHKDRRISRL